MAGPNEGVGSHIFAVARALLLSTQVWGSLVNFIRKISVNFIFVVFYFLYDGKKKYGSLRVYEKLQTNNKRICLKQLNENSHAIFRFNVEFFVIFVRMNFYSMICCGRSCYYYVMI